MQVKYTNFGDKSKGILNKLVFFVFQKNVYKPSPDSRGGEAVPDGERSRTSRNGGESRNPE